MLLSSVLRRRYFYNQVFDYWAIILVPCALLVAASERFGGLAAFLFLFALFEVSRIFVHQFLVRGYWLIKLFQFEAIV